MPVGVVIFVVVFCGALGGLSQSLIGRLPGAEPEQPWRVWLTRVFIGAVTAVVAVGFFLQSDFSEAIGKLFQPTSQPADEFRALMLLASVSLAAGFTGHALLRRMSSQLLKLDTEIKALGGQVKISDAAIAVRDNDPERAIELLTSILDSADVSKLDRARAHGIMANAKKKLRLFAEAAGHVDAAHKLSPEDYRYLFNRACYRWLSNNGGAIDDVFRDLKESLDKGLEFRDIKQDEDLATLRKHERFPEWAKSVRQVPKHT